MQVHGRGKESGALGALVDEQAALAAQAITPGACTGPQCSALRELSPFVDSKERRKLAHRHAQVPEALRSKWLAGNDMPVVGLLMLGSHVLFIPGVILLVVGFTLQAGATGAVKTIKMSAKLVGSQRDEVVVGASQQDPP